MQVLLFATVLFCVEDFVRTEPKPKCTERCDVSTCPSPSCPMGYVPDRCNCCLVCAQGESDPCGRKDDLPCGDGLECKHPAGKRLAKGFCQCKLGHKVCGSDGITYGNVCQLKAQSRKALQQGLPAINSVQKGPCEINNNKGKSFVSKKKTTTTITAATYRHTVAQHESVTAEMYRLHTQLHFMQ